jgi:hypothetical protein
LTCYCEPFFSTYIATGQDGGLVSHLLVDAELQASQVEVGISRKGTENNAGSMGTSETDSVSDTGVTYGIETNRSKGQTSKETKTVERTYKLNQIKHENTI